VLSLEATVPDGTRPIAFLDRDGVLIQDRMGYVRTWADVVFIAGATEAVRALNQLGFAVVVVSNQACIGKGIVTADDAIRIHERMVRVLRHSGAEVDCSYLCPHVDADACTCRKPAAGMLRHALRECAAPPPGSFAVGDKLSDVLAARELQLPAALVRTGHGIAQQPLVAAADLDCVSIHASLDELVRTLKQPPETAEGNHRANHGSTAPPKHDH
jgi:D-glycero-D-manno-heptose 1,7-bisphosphate phosphatase